MTTELKVHREPFVEIDSFGTERDLNRITAEVIVDGETVWKNTVETDDSIESVCGIGESQYDKALEYASKNHGYKPDLADYEAAGWLVPPTNC